MDYLGIKSSSVQENNNKKILIIYPHFPPSNLAGVHRPRLFAQHLSKFGWTPVILTVDEAYYEEKLDWNLVKLLSTDLKVVKVQARKIGKSRFIGDIGLRAFFQLYKKAKQLIQEERIDFLYIPIPSFYVALLGRWLNRTTRIPYGIDYIDPWVHHFPGSEKVFSRHWLSTKIASWLEPIAVKNASLITGVAAGYYLPVFDRNPHLLKKGIVHGAMPYGGEQKDHELLNSLQISPYLFKSNPNKVQLIYAGAMLPKSYVLLEVIFKSVQDNPELYAHTEFHFIGTGKTPNDPAGFNIKPMAEKYGLWEKVVFEYPARIPYLDVLVHLDNADAVFILGSTEPHYTPSKTYQGVLSKKPLMAILHSNSTAVEVIRKSNAGVVLDFNGEDEVFKVAENFNEFYQAFLQYLSGFHPEQVDMTVFNSFSAEAVTCTLAGLLDKALNLKSER